LSSADLLVFLICSLLPAMFQARQFTSAVVYFTFIRRTAFS